MGGDVAMTCLLLAPLLLPTSAIRMLHTMKDLSTTGYGCPNPRHGLQLLRWLAQSVIYFDNNGIMRARFLDNQYGFHYYGNYENILPTLHWDQQYFEVGNLNYNGADALPYSVRAAYDQRQGTSYEYNMDRIVVQRRRNSNEIGAVYITEHQPWSGTLNSQNTFRISPDLIRSLQSPSRATSFQHQYHGNLQFNNQAIHTSRFQVSPSQDQTFCVGLCWCLCLLIIFIFAMIFLGASSGGKKW
ncbi:uncharacterized protein LOC125720612 [Brienomyrus brachyistius]|uniref:uncharacterized protein LOC125720612 n=1 Tax=Brienomyrus brachyistius TaxID=42636 RepID=UPI0020B373D5|nr:uncharacterized protein LOC125720612 [Brienomyrus brachyistius]XP_048852217.1 uncharacterized protein LOC125720612 [Brienomyrus brachyistius]